MLADRCDIFTDVDGVYSSDPNIEKDAQKIDVITYEDMLKLANNGAKVLHNKCVEIAMNNNVPIYVKSTFKEDSSGTLVTSSINIKQIV